MTPPVKPETGGWWDDFVANAFDIIEGPNPGAFQGAQDAITRYGHKVAGNVKRDFIDPLKTAEGQLQWLKDWTTPGPEALGAVGKAGGHKAVKKALEKLRAAAVRSEDGRIFEGTAHPFAFMEGEDAGAVFTGHADDEGFIHPKLGYITRRQAKEMGYFAKSEKDVAQTVQVADETPVIDELPDDIDAQIAAIAAKHAEKPAPKKKAKAGVVPEGTPNEMIRKIADEYNTRSGLQPIRRFDPVKHDEALSREVAEWYEKAQDAPDLDEVKAAYEAFNRETEAQYDELVKQGWEFTPTDDAVLDAYPGAAEMRFDASNKKLKVFTGGEPNKLMTPEQNFKFRAVHDVMAHTSEGYDFHPDGEWNAALKHSQMYTPQAQRALFTETVGQNANLNYGPNGEFNRANPGKEIFPQQKATLLPPEFADRLTRLVQGETPKVQVGEHPAAPKIVPPTAEEVRGFGLGGYTPEQVPMEYYFGRNIDPKDLHDAYNMSREAFDARGPFRKYLEAGRKFPGSAPWYESTKGIYRDAADELGETEAAQRVNALLGGFMPASTARSSPPSNLRRAFMWQHLARNGKITPEILEQNAVVLANPFGHFAQTTAHQPALAHYLRHGRVNPFNNPKPASFGANLTGNQEVGTFDTVMSRVAADLEPGLVGRFLVEKPIINKKTGKITGHDYSPRDWAYEALERGLADAAHDARGMGLLDDVPPELGPTAAYQSIGWHGATPSAEYGSMYDVWKALRKEAAGIWGVSEREANRRIWKEGRVPLLPDGVEPLQGLVRWD